MGDLCGRFVWEVSMGDLYGRNIWETNSPIQDSPTKSLIQIKLPLRSPTQVAHQGALCCKY